MALCPKCAFEAGDEPQCPRCGVIFDRMHTIVELRPLGARVDRPPEPPARPREAAPAPLPSPAPAKAAEPKKAVPVVARLPREDDHRLRNGLILALAVLLGVLGARAWLSWHDAKARAARAAGSGWTAPSP